MQLHEKREQEEHRQRSGIEPPPALMAKPVEDPLASNNAKPRSTKLTAEDLDRAPKASPFGADNTLQLDRHRRRHAAGDEDSRPRLTQEYLSPKQSSNPMDAEPASVRRLKQMNSTVKDYLSGLPPAPPKEPAPPAKPHQIWRVGDKVFDFDDL